MHAMNKRLAALKEGLLFSSFKRVLLQDSTTLSLPSNLVPYYPGSANKVKQHAVVRLQCLINIKTMHWLQIALNPFTSNDQSASKLSIPLLQKDDLLIRDLGYFSMDAFKQIQHQQAFYISRLRYGVNFYNARGKLVNWKQLCKAKGIIDREIYAGLKQKLKVRIVMIPLPLSIAAEKIRKAKRDRDKRLNHSKDYYRWLAYKVFITNIAIDDFSAQQINETYKVRWQIEMVFKAWKSGLHMQEALHEKCTNIYRAETSIYLLLMLFCLIVQQIYILYNKKIKTFYGRYLSLLRLCNYIRFNLAYIVCLSKQKLKQTLAKYCCYEIRSDRLNMTELILNKN